MQQVHVMFRFVTISTLNGSVIFSHYMESIPIQLRVNMEKDIVHECLNTGAKEGQIQNADCLAVFKREGLLIIVVGTVVSANVNIALDLLHSFVYILVHYLKNTTEIQTIHNKEIIHELLTQMVHGNILETRISHIEALCKFRAQNDGN